MVDQVVADVVVLYVNVRGDRHLVGGKRPVEENIGGGLGRKENALVVCVMDKAATMGTGALDDEPHHCPIIADECLATEVVSHEEACGHAG